MSKLAAEDIDDLDEKEGTTETEVSAFGAGYLSKLNE